MLWSLLIIFFIVKGCSSNGCSEPQRTVPATAHCNTEIKDLANKSSSQSSTHIGGDNIHYISSRAFDGNYTTCSSTNRQPNSWWKIDLQGVYNISCISIFNKKESHTDISGAKIYIGNSRQDNGNTNTLVQNITGFKECHFNVYNFKPSVGRYITVFNPGNKPTVLCEVNITGSKIDSPFELVKEKMIWEDALYHCREKHMDLASILDEEQQAFAELEAERADTDYVWLGLHFTCTLQFWFWVDDNSVAFQHWHDNGKIENCDMSGVMEKKDEHFWVSKSDYEMYNFICAVR